MTTSGSFDFQLKTNEIIDLSLRRAGELADGEIATAEQTLIGRKHLNAMTKAWRAEGIYLWTIDWITIPMVASSIVLGTDGFDYETIRNHKSALDNRPITGAKHPSFWKKLATSTGATWVVDTNFTSIANYSLDKSVVGIDDAKIRFSADNSDRPLTSMTREEYFNLGNVTTLGDPNRYWFNRLTTPEIFLYPFPDSTTEFVTELATIKFFQDFDTGNDMADFLQEWLEPLVDGLAYRLANRGRSATFLSTLRRDASDSKDLAKALDSEKGDVQFIPDMRVLPKV